jgi:hypothetical protein
MAGVTRENRTATTSAEGKTARDIDTTSTPAARAASAAAPMTGEPQRAQNPDPGWMDRVRERAGEQLTNQKNRATEGIGTIAHAVRNTTQDLREHQHETIAEYVTSAADQLERLAARLKNKDAGELFRDAQNLARRQPVMFVGSAFVLGLLGARFLKSSPPPDRNQERSWQQRGVPIGSSPQPRPTEGHEGRAIADPSMSRPSRPVVSNPDAGAGMTPETRYGER